MLDFIDRAVAWADALPGPLNALVTGGFHLVVAASAGLPGVIAGRLGLAVLGALVVAVLYTRREEKQIADNGGFTAPEYDHLGDVVGPWLAVIGYALLV